MTAKTMKTPLFLSILALAAAGCGDIEQKCYIQRPALGGYGMIFTATAAATGTCTPTETAALPDNLGDIYTMDKFRGDQSQVGVRPGSLLDVTAPSPTTGNFTIHAPTAASLALGDFASLTPDADHICTVPTLTVANGESPAATGRSIALSNLVFLTGSLYQGSQLQVDATYTVNGCSRPYHGLGLTPIVNCDPTNTAACDPVGNPGAGVPASGINASFPVTCDAAAGALLPFRYNGSPTGSSNGDPICWLDGTSFPVVQ
jgi:hypothetical protein